MAGLTTAFLYAFALDAVLTLADLGLYLLTGFHVLGFPLALLTLALIPWMFLMLVAMAFSPRLPKRILLPVCAVLGWQLFGSMPLPLHVSWTALSSIGSVLALGLSAVIFRWMKSQTGVYQITDAWLEARGPAFRWGHLLAYGTAFALLVPLAFASYAFLSARTTLDHFTAGFMELRLDGLYSIERQYERADQQVHLVGMIHIGQEDFYRELLESLPVEDTVVLAEGVKDETGRLGDFSYGRLAEVVNLSEQGSFDVAGGPQVIDADVDSAEFSDATVDVLNAVGRLMRSESQEELLEAISAYGEVAAASGVLEVLLHDALELRNRHLLEKLDEALAEHARAIIPWGAAHMRGVEPEVLARNFERVSEVARRVIAFY